MSEGEMVERVAEAIFCQLDERVFTYVSAKERSDWHRAARAGICAMLEPTDTMTLAGITQADECNADVNGGSAACTVEHVWRAMIDLALQ